MLDVMIFFKLELVINRCVVLSHINMCAYKCLSMYVMYSPTTGYFSKLHLHCIWQGGNNHDGEFISLFIEFPLPATMGFSTIWFSPQASNDNRNNYLLA